MYLSGRLPGTHSPAQTDRPGSKTDRSGPGGDSPQGPNLTDVGGRFETGRRTVVSAG